MDEIPTPEHQPADDYTAYFDELVRRTAVDTDAMNQETQAMLQQAATMLGQARQLGERYTVSDTEADLPVVEIQDLKAQLTDLIRAIRAVSRITGGLADQAQRFHKEMTEMPRRDDAVAVWLKAYRDQFNKNDGNHIVQWNALDDLLDEYRLRSDTGLSLADDIEKAGP